MTLADPTKTRCGAEYEHDAPFLSCRFYPTGRFLFAGAQDNTIQRWDLESGRQTFLTAHKR